MYCMPMRAKQRHVTTISEQTFDNSHIMSSSFFLNWWSSKQRVEILDNCSMFLFASSQSCFTHCVACPSRLWNLATTFACGGNNFLSSLGLLFGLHSRWVHLEYTWWKNVLSFSRSTCFIHLCHMSSISCLCLAILMSSTHTVRNRSCWRCTSKHSHVGAFSYLAEAWPCQTLPGQSSQGVSALNPLERNNRILNVFQAFGCRGTWIQTAGEFRQCRSVFHFDLGVSGYCVVRLSSASSVAIVSRTFAAVICDADELCSLNAAYEPESSFTTSPRRTTRPSHFWSCCSDSEFLRWHRSMNATNWTVLLTCRAFLMTSSLLVTFVTCQAGKISCCAHSLSTAAFAPRILHCLESWNRFVHKMTMTPWIEPLYSNKMFMISGCVNVKKNIRCRACPTDNINTLKWSREDTSLGT